MNEKRLRNIVKEYKDSHNRDFAPKTAYDEKQAYANNCLGQLVEEIERTINIPDYLIYFRSTIVEKAKEMNISQLRSFIANLIKSNNDVLKILIEKERKQDITDK